MHTKSSPNNPHSYNRYGFAWEHIPERQPAHLDFGCRDGEFLSTLKIKNIGHLVGVDVSRQAVEKGQKLFPELEILKVGQKPGLPFDNGTFSSITVLDVLEHVYEQKELLDELNRVLKIGGRLIVTVPGRHLFSFLDMGNFKFIFPRLHKWYYCLGHSQQEYEYRYVSNPDGLVGDVSAQKRRHEHFSREKLRKMLEEAGFSIIDFDGAGFFSRVIADVNWFLKWFKPLHSAINRLQRFDKKLFESTHLFCVAEKHKVVRDV